MNSNYKYILLYSTIHCIFRAPSIIVMDDIDSMFANRDKTQNEAIRRLVSTLLTLMDGIVSVGIEM